MHPFAHVGPYPLLWSPARDPWRHPVSLAANEDLTADSPLSVPGMSLHMPLPIQYVTDPFHCQPGYALPAMPATLQPTSAGWDADVDRVHQSAQLRSHQESFTASVQLSVDLESPMPAASYTSLEDSMGLQQASRGPDSSAITLQPLQVCRASPL